MGTVNVVTATAVSGNLSLKVGESFEAEPAEVKKMDPSGECFIEAAKHEAKLKAEAAAKALVDNTGLGARDIVKKSLEIAGELCIYTNMNHTIETLG